MVGRIREIVFEDGVDVDGIATLAASQAYVNALFDPITGNAKGIYLENTSGLPTLSPWRAGVIAWDTQNKCMAVSTSYSGSWMQVGQEMTDDAVNKTGGALANGTVVYFESSQGNRPKMWKAYCTDDSIALKTIGLVTQDAGIADNAEGPVTVAGVVRNLNTNAYTEGDLLWLDTVAGGYTKTLPSNQYHHICIGIVIKSHITQGEIYVSVKDLTDEFAKAAFHIIDPHGFTEYDNTYMTRGWVGNTFTLTQVGASTPYYCKGKLKYLTGNKSIALTPTLGAHFIGLNCTTEVLEDLGGTIPADSVVSTHILAEFAYADGTNVIYKANERHTTKFLKRDWFYKHLYLSTQYRSGIQPSITSVDGNGSSNTHAQFSTTSGQIADEDIEIVVAAKSASNLKALWYYDGTKWVTANGSTGSGVLPAGTGRAAYNNVASGLVECTDNYHVLTHLFAANDGTLIGVIGNAQYQLLAAARLAASTEIDSLITTGLPFPEFRAIATFINKTKDTYSNATKSIIVSVDTGVTFIDWRKTSLNPVAGSNASNHQSLSGLQGGQAAEYYHVTAAQNMNIVNNLFPTGTSTDTTYKILLPTNTTVGWAGLTPTESLIGWDSTKKKPVVGTGTAIVPIGGGLVATPIDKNFATSLESGKHYLFNGAGMTADKTIMMPVIAAESYIRVTVYNIPTGYKLILTAEGTTNFLKDDTDYGSIYFVAVEIQQSSSFVSNNTKWVVDDGSNALGTVLSGSWEINGTFKVGGGSVITKSIAPIITVYDSGTNQTYNTPTGTLYLKVRLVGPGGSGAPNSGGGTASGGGGAGGYAESIITNPDASYSYSCAGLGSHTTFGSMIGYAGSNSAAVGATSLGGTGGGSSGGNIVNLTGQCGGPGWNYTSSYQGGYGGSSFFGGGGAPGCTGNGNGLAAVTYGSGGGGGVGGGASGSGFIGVIIIEAHYI